MTYPNWFISWINYIFKMWFTHFARRLMWFFFSHFASWFILLAQKALALVWGINSVKQWLLCHPYPFFPALSYSLNTTSDHDFLLAVTTVLFPTWWLRGGARESRTKCSFYGRIQHPKSAHFFCWQNDPLVNCAPRPTPKKKKKRELQGFNCNCNHKEVS